MIKKTKRPPFKSDKVFNRKGEIYYIVYVETVTDIKFSYFLSNYSDIAVLNWLFPISEDVPELDEGILKINIKSCDTTIGGEWVEESSVNTYYEFIKIEPM